MNCGKMSSAPAGQDNFWYRSLGKYCNLEWMPRQNTGTTTKKRSKPHGINYNEKPSYAQNIILTFYVIRNQKLEL
jgi:hypothetical protein